MIDKNRIEGAAKEAVGKVEDAVSGLTGDTETEAAGKARQAAGKFQNAYGRTSDEVRNAAEYVNEVSKERPVAALLVALAVGFFLGRISVTARS
jgi:uncharacterized protein YjbJ (UPF0337 family)